MNLRSTTAAAVLGSLLLLVLATAGWLLALGPTTSAISEQREATVEAADRNLLLTTQLAQLQAKADDLGATTKAEKALARLFPPTAEQPAFFGLLDDAARRAGYGADDIVTLSPTAPGVRAPQAAGGDDAEGDGAGGGAPGEQLALQTVTLSVSGSADSARRLLGELEELERAFLVRSVTLSGTDADGVSMTVVGTTFVAAPVPPPGDLPALARGDGDPADEAEARTGTGPDGGTEAGSDPTS